MAFTIAAADVAVAQPRFIVEVYNDFVHIFAWPAAAAITLTIDDPDNGVGVDFTKVQAGPANTGFNINFHGEYDVQPGYLVTVTDGTTTLSHVVRDLTITHLDPAADRVEGSAEPGSGVSLRIGGPEAGVTPFATTVAVDGSGAWVVDLAAAGYDLLPGAWTSANQPAGLVSGWTSFTLNPTFNVHLSPGPDNDFVHTWGWPAGVELTLTIDDPDTPEVDFEDSAISPPGGSGLGFAMDSFEIEQGFLVTITDGLSTVTHPVRQLYVTQVDVSSSAMSVGGTAGPGSLLRVEAQTSCGVQSTSVEANAAGHWIAGPFCPGTWGSVWQQDVVSNSTVVGFVASPPVVHVDIDVKPGSFPNAVNPESRGVIPVAILTTSRFDAASVDPTTVRFGPASAVPVGSRLDDVDSDGDFDLVLHFATASTGITCGSTVGVLTGATFGSVWFQASDALKAVGCR
jgi:hypothetical protein